MPVYKPADIRHQLRTAIEGARLRCDEFVIIEALPYFAQLMPNFGAIYGEVVSNVFLEEADYLTARQEAWLLALGWTAPNLPCHPACQRDDHPNFTRLWRPTTRTEEVAHCLLEGLMVAASRRGEAGPRLKVKVGRRVTTPTRGDVPGH